MELLGKYFIVVQDRGTTIWRITDTVNRVVRNMPYPPEQILLEVANAVRSELAEQRVALTPELLRRLLKIFIFNAPRQILLEQPTGELPAPCWRTKYEAPKLLGDDLFVWADGLGMVPPDDAEIFDDSDEAKAA